MVVQVVRAVAVIFRMGVCFCSECLCCWFLFVVSPSPNLNPRPQLKPKSRTLQASTGKTLTQGNNNNHHSKRRHSRDGTFGSVAYLREGTRRGGA